METVFDLGNLNEVGKSFQHYGYVRIRHAVSMEDVIRLRQEVAHVLTITSQLPNGLVWFSPAVDGGQIIQRISRINVYSRFIHDFGNTHPTLLTVTKILLGADQVRFADGSEGSEGSVLVIKDPANAGEHKELRWHRDAKFTQHLPINPFVNLGVYLDDSGAGLGGLVVLPTSHRVSLFDPDLEETTKYHSGGVCVEASTCDIVIHSSEIWHCSRAHAVATQMRRVLYFNFHAVAGQLAG
jgi:hypothetical protein